MPPIRSAFFEPWRMGVPISRVGRACVVLLGLLLAVEGFRRGVLHKPPLEFDGGGWLPGF